VTCHDARELFSALVDEVLTPDERPGLEAHLAGCPECRRELERFRQAVGLVQALPADRAPAGFVDRVLAAARPEPWPRRLVRALLVPWTVKLPLEAMALLLVGGLAVLVFRGVEEQQRVDQFGDPGAGVDRAPAVASRPIEAPGAADRARDVADGERHERATAPQAVPSSPDTVSGQAMAPAKPDAASKAPATREFATTERDAGPPPAAETPAPGGAAGAGRAPEADVEQRTARAPTRETPAGRAPTASTPHRAERGVQPPALQTPASPAPPGVARTPGPEEGKAGEPLADRKSKAGEKAADTAGRLGATRNVVAADVSGRLVVADPADAEAALADLARRFRGNAAARRAGGGARIVEITVPRERYPDLVRELARLGSWQPEAEPRTLPDTVRLVVRVDR